MPGIPNKAFHFLELQRNVFLCLSLFSISTFHLPNCVIVVWLYVLSLVASLADASLSIVALGNNFVNILNDIMFPSLPISNLYDTIMAAVLDDVF